MSGFIPAQETGWQNVYPQQIPPFKSPDAVPEKVDQKSGSAIYNEVQARYIDSNGTMLYQFKSNQERMAYKAGLLRTINISTGLYSNYPNYS